MAWVMIGLTVITMKMCQSAAPTLTFTVSVDNNHLTRIWSDINLLMLLQLPTPAAVDPKLVLVSVNALHLRSIN